ncbi:hypothetical protein NliqN6_3007 [Naganishia liquefaciens]|uniref:C2H2-type domain-containing protein n=1 Tax=Naganishia liquefaciens TaxID=104408 RepID=A0A8H3YEJ2_9TREE|nr:hypothetical protein NliqN6_3007 [Naganishia liquefaciens]
MMDCSEQGCCDLDEFVCQDHDMVGACTDDHGLEFGPAFGLGTNIELTAAKAINSANRNQYGPTNNTTQAPQSRAHNDPFAALLSAVVQDATNSGILQIPNSMPTGVIPRPRTATEAQHKRSPSLAQIFEQQQKQLQGNVVLGRNPQGTQQPQHDRSHQPSASPSIFSYPPTSSPRESAGTPRSDASRQSQLYSNKLMPQNVTNHRSPSAITPESNISLHDSALAYASRLGSQSATSSVSQTPSPLLDALASNFASHEATRVASASSSELVDCPAKKVTKSDCHDHAHVRGQPVLHVCHWQNCHASFTTVQNLLQHISQSHLGLNVGLHANEGFSPVPIQQDAARMQADMNPAKNALGKAGPDVPIHLESDFQSLQEPINLPSNPDVASVLDNILSSSKYSLDATAQSSNSEPISQPLAGLMPSAVHQTATNASKSSEERFASSGDFILNGSLGSQFQNTASQEPTATSFAPNSTNSAGGPIACLWDDCPPFDPFAHFGQQCLDDTCGILPGDVSNATFDSQRVEQSFDARMLTCDPFCAKDHTHLFPCEPTCSQEHTHVYPMHLHTYPAAQPSNTHNVQLDSATAVLKHLLQQHLGVDLTQGLLNVASQQLGDASALNTATNGHASSTSSAPVTRRASTEKHACSGVQRKCKPLRAPPRKPADDAPADPQTHTCRWYGCTQTFGSVEELTEHLSDVHIGKGKTEYECLWAGCETCGAGKSADGGETPEGRKFTTRQKVMRHMQAHTGYRPFVCPICGTAVSEQATLVAHIRRHSEDRPFHCDAEGCGKSFASAASLAVHKRTHEGQKEHVCPYCDKGFVEASNLNKHIRTHTGEKPFKCQQPGCSKKFSRPDQLKRHAQIHERTDKNPVATSEMATSGTDESA